MPLPMSFFGFGMWTTLDNFHMRGFMLLLRAVLNMICYFCSVLLPLAPELL